MIDILVKLKNSSVKTGLQQMKSDAENFKRDVGKSFAGAFNFQGIKSGLLGAFAGITGAIGIGSIFAKAGQIDDVADKFGFTATEVQRLAEMGREAGISMEDMARGGFKAVMEAQKALYDPGAREHFKALGISMEQLARMNGPEEVLLGLADAVDKAKDKHAALTAVAGIFGERQAALITLVMQSKDAMLEAANAADIMSDKTVSALAKAESSWGKLINKVTVFTGNAVGVGIDFIEDIAASFATAGEFFTNGFDLKKADQFYKDLRKESTANQKDEPKNRTLKDDAETILARTKAQQEMESSEERSARLRQEIADTERERALEAMSSEERVNALIAERAKLLDRQSQPYSEEARLEMMKEVLELEGRITQERDNQDNAKKQKDKAIADLFAESDEMKMREKMDAAKDDKERAKILRERQAEILDKATMAVQSGDLESELKFDNEARRIGMEATRLEGGAKGASGKRSREKGLTTSGLTTSSLSTGGLGGPNGDEASSLSIFKGPRMSFKGSLPTFKGSLPFSDTRGAAVLPVDSLRRTSGGLDELRKSTPADSAKEQVRAMDKLTGALNDVSSKIGNIDGARRPAELE